MKYQNEFTDMMGVTIETGDTFLDKRLNSHICYKGNDQSATTSASIPDFLKPYITGLLGQAQGAQAQGQLSQVAGFNQAQQQAIGEGHQAASAQQNIGTQAANAQQDALTGTGLFAGQDLSAQKDAYADAARSALGGNLANQAASASSRGVLGSLRSEAAKEKARESTAGTLAGQFAQLDQADLAARRGAQQSAVGQTGAVQAAQGAGAQTRAGIGQQQQAQAQKEADSTFQGLQRLSGLYGIGAQSAIDRTKTADTGGK